VPLVELPLGATEDRICGTIDIEKALMEGKKVATPPLLTTSLSPSSALLHLTGA
jgi:Mg-chelatase subunit ChlI